MPDPFDEGNENAPDTASVEDSENDSCMLVHGDEDWGRSYEKMSVGIVWSGKEEVTATPNEDDMEEDEDTIDRALVGHNGEMPAEIVKHELKR